MARITLAEPDNAKKVVAAFQSALDVVVNKQAIEKLIADRYDHHNYQHVHPKAGSAVGEVAVIMGAAPHKDLGSLFVEVHAEGSQGRSVFVPPSIAERLFVSIPGTSLKVNLTFDPNNKWYGAFLQCPLQVFRDHPHAVIRLR